MKWIVGLGNPGGAYAGTRHNVGFMALDRVAERFGVPWKRSWRFPVWFGSMRGFPGEPRLVKPRTYMNRSGLALERLARARGLAPGDLILVYDDVDLPCGALRVRRKGGASGHNGVASVIGALGTESFARVRVGVGPRPEGGGLVEFVLSPFREEERRLIEPALDRVAEVVQAVLTGGLEAAMNRFNG